MDRRLLTRIDHLNVNTAGGVGAARFRRCRHITRHVAAGGLLPRRRRGVAVAGNEYSQKPLPGARLPEMWIAAIHCTLQPKGPTLPDIRRETTVKEHPEGRIRARTPG